MNTNVNMANKRTVSPILGLITCKNIKFESPLSTIPKTIGIATICSKKIDIQPA